MLTALIRRLLPASPEPLADARRHYAAGRLAKAEKSCRAAARGRDAAEALQLLSAILRETGRTGEAVIALRLAVDESREPATLLEMGRLLLELGSLPDAITALERAVTDSGSVEALLTLARAYLDHRRVDDAKRCCLTILERSPQDALALRSLAALLHEEGDVDQARATAARCITASGDTASRLRRVIMLPIVPRSVAELREARERMESELDELLDSALLEIDAPELDVGRTAFYLAYHAENVRPLMTKLAAVYRRAWHAPERYTVPPHSRGMRLRVGFVSANFRSHSVGKTTIGFIRDLPKERFETFVFSIGHRGHDVHAERIAAAADQAARLPSSLEAARGAIAQARLDALVFADIGMEPLTYFLAFYRLAPLQLTTWGHPVTSGIDTIDWYYSSADTEADGSRAHYSETLVAPQGFHLAGYARPMLREPRRTRESLGLPQGRLYICPQSTFKLHPDFDASLAAILARDDEAQVLLLDWSAPWTALLRQRLAPVMGRNLARVHFMPACDGEEFLQRLAAADVALDPYHFGGCNSSLEALSVGTPVVTLPGQYLGGRFTQALLRRIDAESCIARNADEYVDRALALAREPDYRHSIAEQIAANAAGLFERKDAAQALADALERHFS
jgi:protein O-GlcNAc transferase